MELLAPYLEDIVIAQRMRERIADHRDGEELTPDELEEQLGLNRDEVTADVAEVRELGILRPPRPVR